MNAEQKIRAAIEAKNWKVADYNYERPFGCDREGGYDVTIELDNYPELEGDVDDKFFSLYMNTMDNLNSELQTRTVGETVVFESGSIMGYKISDVLHAINLMPDRLTLT